MKDKKKLKEKQSKKFKKIAKFIFPLGEENVKIIKKALKVETKKEFSRTEVKIKTKGRFLILKIFADDLSSLRAVINSYLRWILMANSLTKDLRDEVH